MTTEKTSLFSKILFATQVTLALGAMSGASLLAWDFTAIDRVGDAYAIATVEKIIPTVYKVAFEGYGDTCVMESWNYPIAFEGIADWKASDRNAKASVITPMPNAQGCDDNFNPLNPDVPYKGKDYGNDNDLHPEAVLYPSGRA